MLVYDIFLTRRYNITMHHVLKSSVTLPILSHPKMFAKTRN